MHKAHSCGLHLSHRGSKVQEEKDNNEQPRVVATEAVLEQRTYFTPVLCSYVGGLLFAFAANSITHMGQVGDGAQGRFMLASLILKDWPNRAWLCIQCVNQHPTSISMLCHPPHL